MTGESAPGLTAKSGDVVVLGLGNVLLGDDGIGAAAIARIERDYRLPPGVRLVEGGTLGLSLLGVVAEAEHMILVDAVFVDRPPGALVRIDGADVADAVRDRLSPHQVGVADLLEAARLIDRYPTSVTLLGLAPESLDLAVVRSRAVDRGLDELVAAVVREVESLGHKMVREVEPGSRDRPIHDLTRHFGM